MGNVWFRVLPLSLFLRTGVSRLLVLSAFFWSVPLSRNLSFISFFSSDRIKLGFLCFLPRRSRIGRKITFNYFLTNFIDISLYIDPIHRNPFFHCEESLSTDNIWWMLLWVLAAIIICVYDKFKEISFGHITLRRVLETWGDLLLLAVSERLSSNTGEKNSHCWDWSQN